MDEADRYGYVLALERAGRVADATRELARLPKPAAAGLALRLEEARLALLAGNDDELFDQLARGAAGAVTASAHLATGAFVRLHALLRDGRLPEARALWHRLAPLTTAAFAEPNPAPVKAALARQGWIADVLRAPMPRAADDTAAALLAAARDVPALG